MQEGKHGKAEAKEGLDFSRLQEEHTKAIQLSKQRIDKWAQFKADYEALQARMYSLPDKLTHDVMVPFGKFAFMPGQVYDTNEIMVLLGDNWFVKRSVKQALEIAERRKQSVAKMLEDEQKQMTEWEARHTFTDSFRSAAEGAGDTVDIKEEYDEEAERKRKERRQRNVKSGLVPPPRPAFPQKTSNTRPSSHVKPKPLHEHNKRAETPSQSAIGGISTAKGEAGKGGSKISEVDKDRDLWARLDELEKEEEEYLAKERERELAVAVDKLSEEKGTAESGERPIARTTSSDVSKEKEHNIGKEAPPKSKQSVDSGPLRIAVKHTPQQETAVSAKAKTDDTDAIDEHHDNALFKSPADIFGHFCKAESSDESSSEVDIERSKRKIAVPPPPPSSSVEKGVKWSPNLVEFSDGSKTQQTAVTREVERKSDRTARGGGGRGRGRGGGRRGTGGGRPKEPTKPPMPFSGQVIERFSPMQSSVSTEQGAAKKVSKFKASRQQ